MALLFITFPGVREKRSSLSKGYTSIDHGCEDGLDGIWNEAWDQIIEKSIPS